ncbi:MAG: hypothetical protein JO077_06255 [Verrucomicrobia bacterium]|nr:hypothetical protein [Verrucomicrobiota bacterium]
MKKGTLFRLALLGCVVLALQNANAGSAVATDGRGHLTAAYGGPVEREKERALEKARRLYGGNFRILASTDVTGYCAIAVSLHPNGYGSIIGVSLGNPSATQADALAMENCRKAGGTSPKVRWAFRG